MSEEERQNRENEQEQKQGEGGNGGRGEGRERRRSYPWVWTGIALASLLILGLWMAPGTQQGGQNMGENTQNRLQQTPGGTTVRQNQMVPDNTPTTPTVMNRRITDAARSVEGVRQAWGLSIGDTALVGLQLDNGVKGEAAKDTIKEVENQVKELPGIDKAAVTADAGLVDQIREIAERIADGAPMTEFTDDMRDLIERIVP